LPYDPRKCLSRPLTSAKENCILIVDEYTNFNDDYVNFIIKINKSFNHLYAFDLNKVFCIESKCTFVKDGIPMLRDGAGHFSEYGLEVISPSFIEFIDQIIAK